MLSVYSTERLKLTLAHPRLAPYVTDYFQRNKEFLSDTEPEREEAFYTKNYQKALLKADVERFWAGSAVKFWLSRHDETRVIGMAAFSNIVMGAFRSCHVGYRLDREEVNKGLMTEALERSVKIAFEEIGLHRLEANILPRNKASLRVAEKLGFQNEGLARKYLKVNGVWEDHIHMVLLNENDD